MENEIYEIISRSTGIRIEQLHAKKEFKGEWTSLVHVELIIAIEENFNVYFEAEELVKMSSPAKIVELVMAKVVD